MRIKKKTMNFAVSSEGSQYRQQRTLKTRSELFILLQGAASAELSKGHHSPVIQTEGDKSLAAQGQDTLCQDGKESSSQMGTAEISASVCSVHDRGLWDFS